MVFGPLTIERLSITGRRRRRHSFSPLGTLLPPCATCCMACGMAYFAHLPAVLWWLVSFSWTMVLRVSLTETALQGV